MRAVMAAIFALLAAAPGFAAEPPKTCVRTRSTNDYNARPIGPHDIWIANAVGDHTPLRLSTTCLHIREDAVVAVRGDFQCVGVGDRVAASDLLSRRESCRVSKVTPFVPGSEAEGYR